jgi:polyribonucleotide nucleotidyltransferase
MVIGPGGKMVKSIREKTGAEIDIEEDGTIFITGKNGAAEAAKEIIEGMTREYKKGERFEGTVVKIAEFGAFVKIGANADGLVHVSEIAPFRVDNVAKYLKVGDVVPVVIKEIDDKKRINLSIKQADPEFIKQK